jgi:hypothetical protein
MQEEKWVQYQHWPRGGTVVMALLSFLLNHQHPCVPFEFETWAEKSALRLPGEHFAVP